MTKVQFPYRKIYLFKRLNPIMTFMYSESLKPTSEQFIPQNKIHSREPSAPEAPTAFCPCSGTAVLASSQKRTDTRAALCVCPRHCAHLHAVSTGLAQHGASASDSPTVAPTGRAPSIHPLPAVGHSGCFTSEP